MIVFALLRVVGGKWRAGRRPFGGAARGGLVVVVRWVGEGEGEGWRGEVGESDIRVMEMRVYMWVEVEASHSLCSRKDDKNQKSLAQSQKKSQFATINSRTNNLRDQRFSSCIISYKSPKNYTIYHLELLL